MVTQCEIIMRHLETGASITAWEAMRDYGIMRLASRINDLKRAGAPIRREMVRSKNRFGDPVSFSSYSLEGGVKDAQQNH